MMRKQFKEIGKQGGLGGAIVKRGFRKRKKRQLKDLKSAGQFPLELGDLPVAEGGDGAAPRDRKKRKKRKR
jgi:hypothetical protein